METIAIPPTTPPAIAPTFELLPFGAAVRDGDPVEDARAEEMADVYTPDGPKIAPGPYSGLSMSNVV